MTYKVTIPGQMPNLNDYLQAERTKFRTQNGKTNTKGNEMKKQWMNYSIVYIRKTLKGLQITNPVVLNYRFYEPNQKRDLDNIAAFAMKVIQDSLVLAKVLKNDGWKQITGFNCEFFVSESNPRIELYILEVENGK